jgi:ubiquitin-protein ligase
VEALAAEASTEDVAEMVSASAVTQLICVCFDESGSMGGYVNGTVPTGGDFRRVTIAAQYLTTFANRAYAYRVPCVQGLTTFGGQIRVRSRLSPLVPDFEDGIGKVAPSGPTRLWDCLSKAADDLEELNKVIGSSLKQFPNAKLRILVISDGEDTASQAGPHDMAARLLAAGIVVDSVVLNTKDTCLALCALCHMTGGLSFRPATVKDGLALFEQEAFLFYEKRAPRAVYGGPISEAIMQTLTAQAVFDTEIPNSDLELASQRVSLVAPRHVLYAKRAENVSEPRERRLLRELKFAAAVQDPNYRALNERGEQVSLFDEGLRIFPVEDRIDVWRIFVRGPVDTPYAGKWWYMLATFPGGYPLEPPVFRFVSVPYNLNVSREGRICLHDLERGYGPNSNVVELIQMIKPVFLTPDETTPIELAKMFQFRENRPEYDRLARESSRLHAKDIPEEFLVGCRLRDAAPKTFALGVETVVPPWMRSPFTGMPIPPDKQFRASSGVLYHKDELRQHLAASESPICVVTGKALIEKVGDIV